MEYLKHDLLSNKIDPTNSELLSQLLRLSDFLQIDKLQAALLIETIIPNINNENCLLFLAQACEKRKSNIQLPGPWLLLLNKSMSCFAKNYLSRLESDRKLVFGLPKKLIDQITQRALRFEKPENRCKIVKYLLEATENHDCLQYLKEQKIKTIEKYTSGKHHINYLQISIEERRGQNVTAWRLHTLLQAKTYESEPFWSGGFKWKLISTIHGSRQGNEQKLDLYLKQMCSSTSDTQEKMMTSPLKTSFVDLANRSPRFESICNQSCRIETAENLNFEGILSFCCEISVDGKAVSNEVQIYNSSTTHLPKIHLQTLHLDTVSVSNETQLQLFFNFDFIHSALLENILGTIQVHSKSDTIDALSSNDILIIVKGLPKESQAQGSGLMFATRWRNSFYKF